MIGMRSPNGAHAVVVYQMVEIEEFGFSRLMLYDSNTPYDSLQAGYAPQAEYRPGKARSSTRTTIACLSIRRQSCPANAGQVFADLARTFSGQMLAEITGGIAPLA